MEIIKEFFYRNRLPEIEKMGISLEELKRMRSFPEAFRHHHLINEVSEQVIIHSKAKRFLI